MQQELINSITLMIANGNRLELPTEQITNYPAVKKALLAAGGKYKKCGFEFTDDAQQVKDRLVGGEVINDVKKYQYFPTPSALARRMIELAQINPMDKVLEPSAGQGAIADLLVTRQIDLRNIASGNDTVVIELMPANLNVLKRKGYEDSTHLIEGDFLKYVDAKFDKIVANPPFTKNQDIDHVMHMYSLLNEGGRIVTLMSPSWTHGSQNKQVKFRAFLSDLNAEISEVPEGTFKESGTNIRTMLVVIDKPVSN